MSLLGISTFTHLLFHRIQIEFINFFIIVLLQQRKPTGHYIFEDIAVVMHNFQLSEGKNVNQ